MKKHSVLLNQLKDFGLNPSHWEVKNHGSKFKVSHLRNKHLNLIGEVAYVNKKPCWFNLALLSLF